MNERRRLPIFIYKIGIHSWSFVGGGIDFVHTFTRAYNNNKNKKKNNKECEKTRRWPPRHQTVYESSRKEII